MELLSFINYNGENTEMVFAYMGLFHRTKELVVDMFQNLKNIMDSIN